MNLGSSDDVTKKASAMLCAADLGRSCSGLWEPGRTRRAWDELSVVAVLNKELYSSTAASLRVTLPDP